MKTIPLDKESKNVYDVERVSLPSLLLKGVGRYCEAEGCNNHVFGRKDKTTCSNKCRKRKYRTHTKQQKNNSIQARISIVKKQGKESYRIVSLYLKKGVIHEVKITSESKELWNILEKIANFRDISKPLMELTAW